VVYELWLLRVLLKMKIVCHVGFHESGEEFKGIIAFFLCLTKPTLFFLSRDNIDLVCCVVFCVTSSAMYGSAMESCLGSFCFLRSFFESNENK